MGPSVLGKKVFNFFNFHYFVFISLLRRVWPFTCTNFQEFLSPKDALRQVLFQNWTIGSGEVLTTCRYVLYSLLWKDRMYVKEYQNNAKTPKIILSRRDILPYGFEIPESAPAVYSKRLRQTDGRPRPLTGDQKSSLELSDQVS